MLESIALCAIGLALHFAMKWKEARANAGSSGLTMPGLFTYVMTVPAVSLISLLGAAGAFYVVDGMGWMNPGMAFACGYMPNSMVKNVSDRFADIPKQ